MNSDNAKKGLCGEIKQLDDMGMSIYGERTFKQLSEFEETKTATGGTKLEAPEDGLVIALGLASIGVMKWQTHAFDISPEYPKPPVDENPNYMYFTFEEVMEDIKHQGTGGSYRGYPRQLQ